MKRNSVYNTRQKALILDVLKDSGGRHYTVEAITRKLEENNTPVGKSTVYRYLQKLTEDGCVRKMAVEGGKSDCYQYSGNEECKNHYHLRCDVCGEIIHTECSVLDELSEHIYKSHEFKLELAKCTFHGICGKCMKNYNKEG